jgi:release factor glutamine methyltransferase
MEAVHKRAAREPLAYIIGEQSFMGLPFVVSPDVLIPEQDTENLVEEALRYLEDGSRILDLCTGSGCIAWTLALEIPGAEVTAVDISDDALAVASSQDFTEEIARTGATAPRFIKADVLAGPLTDLGQFDIIVSNPPYVMDSEKALMRSNVLDHEPHLALFVPDSDPLVFYRAVAQWADALLAPDGSGMVEINEALGPQTAEIFRAAGYDNVAVIPDLSDRHRFVSFSRILSDIL